MIAAGGRLGGYGGSEVLKRALLVAEGVAVSGSRVRDLGARPVETAAPLTMRACRTFDPLFSYLLT